MVQYGIDIETISYDIGSFRSKPKIDGLIYNRPAPPKRDCFLKYTWHPLSASLQKLEQCKKKKLLVDDHRGFYYAQYIGTETKNLDWFATIMIHLELSN